MKVAQNIPESENKSEKTARPSPSTKTNDSKSEDKNNEKPKEPNPVSKKTNESLKEKPIIVSQESKQNKLNETSEQIKENQKKDEPIVETTKDLIHKNPFRRIQPVVYNLTIAVISLSGVIIFDTSWNVFRNLILDKDCYLSRDQNWMLCLHSVIIVLTHLVLRSDVYYCSIGRVKGLNLTFHLRVYMAVIFSEFVLITRILFVFYPKRGIAFWTIILLMLSMARFLIQLFILTAIKTAKCEIQENIKLAILKKKKNFQNQQNSNSKS